MFRQISVIVGIAALIVAAPATASVTIDFGGGNSATNGTNGNIATYSNGAVTVQASAWTFNGYSVETAFMGQYSNGLGVTNSAEGAGTLPSANAIDNTNGYDFILLVYNQPVSLLSAVLTPYQVGVGQPDNDATIAYANFTGLFTSPTPTAVATSSPLWAALANTAYSVAGNNSSPFTTAINPGTAYGNAWLVSADILGLDRSPDGFRLSSIAVNTPAVPEPSTWMVMLLGLCGIGSVLRRKNGPTGKLAQIA